VAADGASGRLATRAGIARDPAAPIAVAARRYCRAGGRADPVFETWIGIERDGDWLPGYGWAFPTGDGELNVGAYLIRGGRGRGGAVSAQEAFDVFIAGSQAPRWLAEGDGGGPVSSSAIPMGLDRTRPAWGGLFLVGDAAGLANPFTGEGIGYAMESGELAARAILASLASSSPGRPSRDAARPRAEPEPEARYAAALRALYGRVYRAGRWFAREISRPPVTRAAARYGTRVPLVSRRAIRFMIDAG
jgi:flavin-dependent dehydrogenase